jgi:hypothetical protein
VGYGFEIRVGSRQPGFPAMGVLDAVEAQGQITCNPTTGEFDFTVANLKATEGVKATFSGDNRWDGQFVWDVALVSLNPYVAPTEAAPAHPFEIALSPYRGPHDPNGVPLSCRDFSSWLEAQAFFLAAGGPDQDRHKLDPDGNQRACDELRP